MGELKTNLVCTGCSLLCDDIAVEIENGKIKTTHNVCARGYGRFYQVDFKYRILSPLLKMNGKQKEISYEKAIKESVNLLKNAENPFLYGWASTVSATQKKGIQLAQKYKAAIDCASTCTIGMAIQRFIQENIEISKLPDIRDNADLLVFWGSNPTASHIRLLSKYALLARGKNTDRGMEDRTAITVDIRTTDMARFSEEFLQITPGGDTALLESLMQIIQGKSFSKERVANIPRKTIYNVANLIKEARFGFMFFGNGYVKTQENMDVLIQFIETLKQKGINFGAIPLDGGYNAIGFNKNLKTQVKTALHADFRQNIACKEQSLLIDSLKTGSVDLLFVVGSDPISNLPFNLSKQIAKIPMIAIDFQQTPTTMLSRIVIPTTIPGVESAGTAYRLDFEPVTLKRFLDPPAGVHSDGKIIEDLLRNS
ncbi:MAG: formylmethanofuran dehydrogenase subunit B [Candidatus Helarchaeota archaeon]|nr:formylmethanofuran dehydrogenase subunit B [Candidatus Helarchaeota archaeon]